MTPERAFTESYAYDERLKPLKRGLHYAVNCANRRITTDWHGHFVSLSTYYFAQKQQLEPLGMHHVSMEFDGAQTLIGSTRIYASARDWARFGRLYLDDGVVNGRRLLPAGWAAFSARPTLDAPYGAGFWTNVAAAGDKAPRIDGLPPDAYFASGMNGQRIVIVPSKHLVIVRFWLDGRFAAVRYAGTGAPGGRHIRCCPLTYRRYQGPDPRQMA